jgi:L-fucose isomerase-like protein
MEKLRAGYVSFGTMFYEPARLKSISARCERQLTGAGIELLRTDPVSGEGPEPARAISELKAGTWDFLIVNVLNWIEIRGVSRVLLEFRDKPMILYSSGGFTEDGVLICPAAGAGTTTLRYPMEQWGIKFVYLYNPPDSPMDIEGILRFGQAARAARLLRSSRLGMLGYNDMGLYTTGVNHTKLRSVVGPELESVDFLQLEEALRAVDPAELARETAAITADWEYPLGKPKDAAISRAIALYLATMRIIRDKGFDAFSYKCVDGFDLLMKATHAVPSSLVASAGIPYVDENDVGNMAAELMMKYLTGKQTMFLEVYDLHPEWMLIGEDGYIPSDFIEGKPRIKGVSTVLLDGIAHCSVMKKERMTLACLAEDREGFRLHLVSGVGKEPPRWVEMGVPLPSWPSVEFHPDLPVRRILDHVQSQHFAAVLGDHAEELRLLCGILGIRVVDDAIA